MSVTNRFAEVMESRTLMSATPIFDSAVKIDRLEIHVDLLKFKVDCLNGDVTTLKDAAAIKKDSLSAATTVVPLVTQLRTDIHTMHVTLLGDRLNEAANVLTAEVVVAKELVQKFKDRDNATALAADKTQLVTDRIAVQTAMINGLNSRIATRQAAETTLATDTTAIVTAVNSDPDASPALIADLTKFTSDRTTDIGKITTDLQTLVTARTQLVTDLTASQNS